MSEKVNQYRRACIAWGILIRLARNKNTITYEDLAAQIGIHHRAVKYVLELIQSYCLEKLPPLTILVRNKHSNLPGSGFIACSHDAIPEGEREVFSHHWNTSNPFEFASDNTHFDELVDEITADPTKSEEVYSRVKDRGVNQNLFRAALIKAYDGICAFSGLSFIGILDAAHIIPWSVCERSDRVNPRNGLLLSNHCHRLFDSKLITLNEEYRIIYYDPDMKDRRYSDGDKRLIVSLHKRKINLPSNPTIWPDKRLIKERNKDIDWLIKGK